MLDFIRLFLSLARSVPPWRSYFWSLAHGLIKGSQSAGQQYFYTVKCGAEVAPETQNKPALLLTLALTFSPLSIVALFVRPCFSRLWFFFSSACSRALSFTFAFYCFNSVSLSLYFFNYYFKFYLSVLGNRSVF